ncbi:radical SAM family heme chaperone HemW [Aquifex sp.]
MVKGVYIHIPFCSYKCPYCDFLSLTNSPITPEAYLKLLKKEISLYKDLPTKVETVYFGGGTPTLLEPRQLGEIIEEIDRVLGLSSVKEITVECNPETYRVKEFKEVASAGVNRVSIGAQSFTEKGLRALGRRHGVKEIYECVESAIVSGIENVNVDLIFGWSGQTSKDVEVDLRALSELPVKHVSWYLLTPYEGTPLGEEILKGKVGLPSEEEIVKMHSLITEGLKEFGFRRYELSNWARLGWECKHNLLYWKLEEFLGFGVSAWGFVNDERYGNTRSILKYEKLLRDGLAPVEQKVKLDEIEKEKERIMLGLRLTEGLPREYEKFVPEHLKEFFDISDRVKIKEEHFLISNELIAEVLMEFSRLAKKELFPDYLARE